MVSSDDCIGRVQLKRDGTRLGTGGEVKGKLADGVDSQYSSHYLGTWCTQHYYRFLVIVQLDAQILFNVIIYL